MNELYAKTLLYAYPLVEGYIKQIDDLVLRRALASMYDVSSPEIQCEKIIEYTEQKKMLIYLCRIVEDVIQTFDSKSRDHFDYKYFKKKPKEYYNDFDYMSRSYFRRQTVLVEKFARRIETLGIDDAFFREKCLRINFIKEILKRVKEKEILSGKNKPKQKPNTISANFMGKIKSLSGAERLNDQSRSLA